MKRGFALLEVLVFMAALGLTVSALLPLLVGAVRGDRLLAAWTVLDQATLEIEGSATLAGRLPESPPFTRRDPWGRPLVYRLDSSGRGAVVGIAAPAPGIEGIAGDVLFARAVAFDPATRRTLVRDVTSAAAP